MAFQIEKWYFDAHNDAGSAFIGYAATLSWKAIKLHYNGYTFSPAGVTKNFNSNSFSSARFPDQDSDRLRWKYNDVEAEWLKIDEPIEEVLLDDLAGRIEWKVIFPSAKARIQFRKEGTTEYTGYVEKIRLTIPPWNIPIKELFWGRFLGPEQTIIWIQWMGPVPKNFVYLNGARYSYATITTDFIEFETYSLEFVTKRTLRKGTIMSTVFKKFPVVAALFPKKIFALRENKWLSDSILKQNGKIVCQGNAIHEYVVW